MFFYYDVIYIYCLFFYLSGYFIYYLAMLICPLPENAVFTLYKKRVQECNSYPTSFNMEKHAYVHLLTAVMCQSLHFIKVLFWSIHCRNTFPKERHSTRSFLFTSCLTHTL